MAAKVTNSAAICLALKRTACCGIGSASPAKMPSRPGGGRRLTRWRGARAGHHLRDIIGSAIRPNRALAKIKAGVCRCAREVPNGRLLVDSPSDWDHNLGLRAQSRPLRMMPTLRTLATALCLLGLVATGIVGGCGLGPTAAK